MSGDETRKWAAEWAKCGWWRNATDADLAEAVRVKCLQDDALGECPSVDKGRVRWIWWSQGPLAFIQAVREAVE